MSAGPVDPLSAPEKQAIDHVFELRPTMAVGLGLHSYDGRLPDLSTGFTRRWVTSARELLRRLEDVAESSLPPARQLDRNTLRLLLDGCLFDLEDVRELDRNPMVYLMQPELTGYMVRDYAPLEERASSMAKVLAAVPSLMRTATARLEPVLPRPFVSLAIQMASGLPSHFQEGEGFAKGASGSVLREVHAAREEADIAVRRFVEWLQKERLPHAIDDFALGSDRFQRLLWVREGLATPVNDVLASGRADLARNRARLEEIARREGATPGGLIGRLQEDRSAPGELVPLAHRLTEETREFVRAKQLVSIPEPEACQVRATPPWARDLWTAAMSGPGPFEKTVDGIYWVTTVDPAWDATQVEGWMKTMNRPMMKNTTIHEVWPGHYLQSLHARKSRQSLTRDTWSSYSFAEGWAHYCEQLAVEAGFDGGSTAAEVTQLHDALLRDCRLIVSIGMHTQGMTLDEATRLLRTEAHLEQVHAEREAIRGTYNPEYFCYTLGKLAILDARSKHLHTKFRSSLRAFHDTLLAFGTPPIGFLGSLLATA
jgi:uncharacterized protein (DUF885 family)